MAQWNRSESGILRKFKKKDNYEDLLVFGYACKIFRDDEKALYIDQGKHLIPWMGDEKLKVDRYDCRGHLSEIKRYEANPAGYDANRWLGLDENERKLEQLCDEERYYALTINEEEDEMYKEEEKKRIQTNEYQYSYDVPTNPEEDQIPTVPENDEDEVYVPPPGLDIPADMPLPSTMKENARIEKTAMFVSAQGPQMEILIKAKQANNSQFSFLSQKDPLYKFYRHILNAIKSGRYKQANSVNEALGTSETESGEYYLHPSLISPATSTMELPLPAIPTVPYRPSLNCTYSQLVNRIQSTSTLGENGPASSSNQQNSTTEQNPPNSESTTLEQQQYYQYYMQQQYYEYYNQLSQKSGADALTDPKLAQLQQMIYAQYFQQSSQMQQESNPYAQIVSNVSKDATNLKAPEKPDISKEAVIYDTNPEVKIPSNIQTVDVSSSIVNNDEKPVIGPTIAEKTSLLSLIQNYYSDSDKESNDDEKDAEEIEIPDDETKVVIDKMASYVVKNGKEFEEIVKSRSDPRFVFLNSDDRFNKYYKKRVEEEMEQKKQLESKESDAEKTDESKCINKAKEKKVIAPVSFSIKKMKEEVPKEIKSALPIDEETDEEMENAQETNVPLPIAQPPTLVSSSTQKNYKAEPPSKEDSKKIELIKEKSPSDIEVPAKTTENDKKSSDRNASHEKSKIVVKSDEGVILVKDDPILEMIDLTEDVYNEQDGNDSSREEQKSKVESENVNSCVLDDVSQNSEKSPIDNRALQLERRRKAMAFLKMKSASSDRESSSSSCIKKRRRSNSLDEDRADSIKSVSSESRDERFSKDCESKQSGSTKITLDREIFKSRRSKSEKEIKKYECYEVSDVEDGKNSDRSDGRSRKSHKKKKSHKRKHSKCKHRSKLKKKSRKKDAKYASTSSSDSDSSRSN